jgi:hypothetical protein
MTDSGTTSPPHQCLPYAVFAGYFGAACKECSPRFYRLGAVCLPCPPRAYSLIVAYVLMLGAWANIRLNIPMQRCWLQACNPLHACWWCSAGLWEGGWAEISFMTAGIVTGSALRVTAFVGMSCCT